jgi:hypothetical protein
VEEESENHAEFGRLAGNTLSYGQTVQLLHVKSNKFVTVTSKEIAEIETHCLRVYLDPMGNEGSWFTLLPRFKTMAEGENVRHCSAQSLPFGQLSPYCRVMWLGLVCVCVCVCVRVRVCGGACACACACAISILQIHLGDQIILESKCYNSIFLHVSKETMYQKREVNATTEKSSWRVIPFAPFVPESDSFLKAGDVIRMFHKEAEGYLTNELPDDDFVDEDAEKEKPTATPDPQKDEGTSSPFRFLPAPRATDSRLSAFLCCNITLLFIYFSCFYIRFQCAVYLQLFAGSGQLSDDAKKAPQNSNALWQIELDRPNRGGVVQYETFYRYLHLTSSLSCACRVRVSCVSAIIQQSCTYLSVYHKIQTHRDRSLFGGVSQAEGEERESHLPTPQGQRRERRGRNAEAQRTAAQAAYGTEVPQHIRCFPLPGISACNADPLCVWYGVHRTSLGSASDEEEEELVECTFTTVKEFSSSATLFTVHPLGATIVRSQKPKLAPPIYG